MATMKSFVGLGRAMWADPDRTDDDGVGHTPVHVFRHKATGRLRVILVEDEHKNPAPMYKAKKEQLGLPE